ncbi:HK97-gp10 family putative phage morphogenesis protein [Hyphomicrobium sp. CS1GBMeth3]|uniref:HK97-gp10 family putative phage morphogenesis protein n=1 Tax=Hyphomicrobium sp. CS1GBMeth3 TaxID=1892845 RepID=UPI000931C6C7|nr:HK97-gp10 family putative phage morphogenesis protein [Hyphomicrobium sp. CS1GBMeth3]
MAVIRNRRQVGIKLDRIRRNSQAGVRQVLLRGAQAIQNTAVEGIINPPKTGRIYRSRGRRGARHQASAPGEYPAADTGRLHQSITATVAERPDVLTVQVSANVEYASYLEHGTSKMAPRPFLSRAYAENIGEIRRRARRAVKLGFLGRVGRWFT